MIVLAQPLGVVPDDLLQLGAVLENGKHLVDFLLAFTEDKLGVGVVDDVTDFVHQAVLKEPHADTPGAQGRHLRHQALGAVVADHGDLVPLLQPELDQAQGDIFDVVQVILPGDGAPDPEFLLPHGHTVFAVALGLLMEKLGDREILGKFLRVFRFHADRFISVWHTCPLHPDTP